MAGALIATTSRILKTGNGARYVPSLVVQTGGDGQKRCTEYFAAKHVYPEQESLCVRLHEKGGKHHEMPCQQCLTVRLRESIEAAGIGGDKDTPLFRSMDRNTKKLNTLFGYKTHPHRIPGKPPSRTAQGFDQPGYDRTLFSGSVRHHPAHAGSLPHPRSATASHRL